MVSGHGCSIINLGTQTTGLTSSIVGKTVYSVNLSAYIWEHCSARLAESLEFM